MITEHEIDASKFEARTIIFPAVFAKAVNRFKQIELSQESLDSVNKAISKKLEPSLKDAEENVWAQWRNLEISS